MSQIGAAEEPEITHELTVTPDLDRRHFLDVCEVRRELFDPQPGIAGHEQDVAPLELVWRVPVE